MLNSRKLNISDETSSVGVLVVLSVVLGDWGDLIAFRKAAAWLNH